MLESCEVCDEEGEVEHCHWLVVMVMTCSWLVMVMTEQLAEEMLVMAMYDGEEREMVVAESYWTLNWTRTRHLGFYKNILCNSLKGN